MFRSVVGGFTPILRQVRLFGTPLIMASSLILLLLAGLIFYLLFRLYLRKQKEHYDALVEDLDPKNLIKSLHFDPRDSHLETIRRFAPIKSRTHCLLAPRSKVWASCNWNSSLNLEYNIIRNIPALSAFVKHVRKTVDCFYNELVPHRTDPWDDMETYFNKMKNVRKINSKSSIQQRALNRIFSNRADGFLIEIRGHEYVKDFEAFTNTMRRVVSCLHHFDPKYVKKAGGRGPLNVSQNPEKWIFRFEDEPLSFTTFSPTYDVHHSRYQFGYAHDSCFIFLQSESTAQSFETGRGRNDGDMDWNNPQNLRERIRCRYREEGRPYLIASRDDGAFPSSWSVVHPESIQHPGVEWWKSK